MTDPMKRFIEYRGMRLFCKKVPDIDVYFALYFENGNENRCKIVYEPRPPGQLMHEHVKEQLATSDGQEFIRLSRQQQAIYNCSEDLTGMDYDSLLEILSKKNI